MSLRRRILKSKRLEAAIATTFAAYLRFAFATTRWRYDGVDALEADLNTERSVIVACWHQRIMYSAAAWRVTQRPLAGLHSQSHAGRLAGAIQHRLGLHSIAMHDKKSNRATSLAVARMMKNGTSLGLAADGPLGPARQLNPAVIEWARLTGKPIWLQAFAVRRGWFWKTWDKTLFPLPFTRGAIAYVRAKTVVPRKLAPGDMERLTCDLAAELDALTLTADRMVTS